MFINTLSFSIHAFINDTFTHNKSWFMHNKNLLMFINKWKCWVIQSIWDSCRLLGLRQTSGDCLLNDNVVGDWLLMRFTAYRLNTHFSLDCILRICVSVWIKQSLTWKWIYFSDYVNKSILRSCYLIELISVFQFVSLWRTINVQSNFCFKNFKFKLCFGHKIDKFDIYSLNFFRSVLTRCICLSGW